MRLKEDKVNSKLEKESLIFKFIPVVRSLIIPVVRSLIIPVVRLTRLEKKTSTDERTDSKTRG